MKNKLSIHRVFFFSIIIIAFIVIFFFAIWEISNLYRNFNNDIRILRQEYETKNKDLIKSEVEKLAFYIKQMILHYSENNYNTPLPEIQQEILQVIVDQRYGNDGYFFGSTFDGDALFSNGFLTIGTQSVWDLTDPNGVKIIQEQIKQAANPEGGYVKYSWNKLGKTELTPKISYVVGIPEWQWVIGTGIYLDDIEEIIAAEKLEIEDQVESRIIALVTFMILFLIIFYLVAKLISRKIKRDFDIFFNFFRTIDNRTSRVDEAHLDFPEFKALAHATNFMMDQREISEESLRTSEEKIKQENDFTERALNAQMDTFFLFDPVAGKALRWNKSFEEISGYSAGEIAALPAPQTYYNEEDLNKALEFINGISEREFGTIELNLITKSGEKIPTEYSVKSIKDDQSELLISIGRNITERKRIQKELEKYRDHLEELVKDRTKELTYKNEELQRLNKLFIGREFRIKELKEKLKKMESKK
ncbi:cache domain-containing protein [Candidatus Cloacimonadota bacterium]